MIPFSILSERLQLPKTMTFKDYVGIDDAVQMNEALTESDILAGLQSTNVEADDMEPEEQICSLADAKSLQEVRRFFESQQQTNLKLHCIKTCGLSRQSLATFSFISFSFIFFLKNVVIWQ